MGSEKGKPVKGGSSLENFVQKKRKKRQKKRPEEKQGQRRIPERYKGGEGLSLPIRTPSSEKLGEGP